MGLDKLLYEEGYVHSDNNADNITFNERTWIAFLEYHPMAIYTLLSRESNVDTEDIQYFIEIIDKILAGDAETEGTMSDDMKNELRHTRENLVDMLKR